MAILLTYEIKDSTVQDELKKKLIEEYSYSEIIKTSDGKLHQLPPNTLRKVNITSQSVCKEFKTACDEIETKWLKYFACEYIDGKVNSQD